MRETPEAVDDFPVANREFEERLELRTELDGSPVEEIAEQRDATFLRLHVFGVFQREIEKRRFQWCELGVEAALESRHGDLMRRGIVGEALGCATVEVAWKLVEDQHEGQARAGPLLPRVQPTSKCAQGEGVEALSNALVEGGIEIGRASCRERV